MLTLWFLHCGWNLTLWTFLVEREHTSLGVMSKIDMTTYIMLVKRNVCNWVWLNHIYHTCIHVYIDELIYTLINIHTHTLIFAVKSEPFQHELRYILHMDSYCWHGLEFYSRFYRLQRPCQSKLIPINNWRCSCINCNPISTRMIITSQRWHWP